MYRPQKKLGSFVQRYPLKFPALSPKLGIVMKTSFKTRVLRMGLGSFVNINIFVIKIILFSLFTFSILFEFVKSKSTQMLRPQKRKFRSYVQRYSFKFRAQGSLAA